MVVFKMLAYCLKEAKSCGPPWLPEVIQVSGEVMAGSTISSNLSVEAALEAMYSSPALLLSKPFGEDTLADGVGGQGLGDMAVRRVLLRDAKDELACLPGGLDCGSKRLLGVHAPEQVHDVLEEDRKKVAVGTTSHRYQKLADVLELVGEVVELFRDFLEILRQGVDGGDRGVGDQLVELLHGLQRQSVEEHIAVVALLLQTALVARCFWR